MGYELDHYKDIAESVLKRYVEGEHLCSIDKINYYKAREGYYSAKMSETEENTPRYKRFKRKMLSSRKAWRSLDFRVAA